MRFERISGAEHSMYERALELYRISFPDHEQREPESQAAIMCDEAYHFALIYDEDIFVGLMLYWEAEDFIYVEHFCILPEMRNKKYGQRALEMLSQKGKQVILEIDPPVDTVSERRKGFYERCGFTANSYAHVHPPYHRGNEGHALVIMSCPGQASQETYDRFASCLRGHVMANVFS